MNGNAMLQHFRFPLFGTRLNGEISYMNLAAERFLGASLSRLDGLPIEAVLTLVLNGGGVMGSADLARLVEGESTVVVTTPENGDTPSQDFLISVSPVEDDAGERCGYTIALTSYTDIPDALGHHLRSRLDPLTELLGRKEFERRLENLVNDAAISSRTHALLNIDIDQFKLINDIRGHVAGDNLIKQVAELLNKELYSGDTLCRLGGDEFGILLSNVDQYEARSVASRLVKVVKRMDFVWDGISHSVSISAGVVLIDETSQSRERVMSQADIAVYSAKEEGRGKVHVYDVRDNQLGRMRDDMEAVQQINVALERNDFMLVEEKIIPLSVTCSPDARYAELLIRMCRDGKVLSPGYFMPAAERFGLMPQIDRWVLETFVRYAEGHPELNDSDAMFSINLSGQSLCQEAFLEFVYRKLERSRFNPALVCFEITETVAIRNFQLVKDFISRVHGLGGRFALDDFGTGMSSFGYLQELPVDFVKIDGMFVRDMDKDPVHEAMVRTINDISHVLGKKTIAEFVEREEIAERLKELKVDYFQGHIYGAPQPLIPQ